ncbi:hypothetical protein D3C87_1311390 [compost metagenome]
MAWALLKNVATSNFIALSGEISTMKCRQNEVAVAPICGLAMPSAPKNNGTPIPRQSMAKLLHCGSRICPTQNAAGMARKIPRMKLMPICAPFSRLANRLHTTQVSSNAPEAAGQAVASQKHDTTRNAKALRAPNTSANDRSRCGARVRGGSTVSLPSSTAFSAALAASAVSSSKAKRARQKLCAELISGSWVASSNLGRKACSVALSAWTSAAWTSLIHGISCPASCGSSCFHCRRTERAMRSNINNFWLKPLIERAR